MKHLRHLFTALLLLFVAVGISAQEFPTVSTDGNVRWYAIRFVSGTKCITAYEAGEVTTASLTGDDAQMWKITGNETDGYTFTNKNGFILYVNAAGKNELVKAGTEEVVVSRFAITGENGYLEIRPNANTSLSMNFWEGTGVKVGLWNCNDANNFVEFVEVFSSGDYVFTLTDGVYALADYTGSDTEIELPAGFNGNSYVIGSRVFYGNTAITSVVIPDGVTGIGSNAFTNCSAIEEVVIGKDVADVGFEAFKGCSGLRTLEILGTPTLQQGAFSHTGLEEVVLPEGITEIPTWSFDNSPNLRSVTIPSSVTSIGNFAFNGCTSLKELRFEDGTETLSLGYNNYYQRGTGKGLFYDCLLETLYLGRNLSYETSSSYGYSPFYNIKTLTSVTIGNNVTSIGSYAFDGCNNLKTVVNYSSLTVTKGSTSNGYVGCYAEKVINVPNGSLEGDFVFGKPNGVNTLVAYVGNETEIILPENYNGENYVIGAEVFKGRTTLTSVTIPNSVTSIGESAFYNCSGLTSVTIGNSVTSIGFYAFSGCLGLTSVTIGNNVTSIYDRAFENCSGLTSITIPSSVTSIGYSAFSGCDAIEKVELNCSSIGNWFRDKTSLKEVVIGNSVTSIGNSAFEDCSGLTSITIPNSVTSIGSSAFYGCSGLTSIEIPNSVTSIRNSAFNGCTSLKELRFEDGTETLSLGYNSGTSEGLFYDCPLETLYLGRNLSYNTGYNYGYSPFYNIKTLTSVTIGNSVTSIGNSAFNGCTSLKELRFEDGTETLSLGYNYYSSAGTGEGLFYDCPLETLYLGRNLSYDTYPSYGYSPFYNKSSLTSVTIGNSVTSIGGGVFSGCNALEKVEFNCAKILSWFSNKSSIKEIVIGNSVTSIGFEAFKGCSGLRTLEILGAPILEQGAFSRTGLEEVVLPEGITEIPVWCFDNSPNLRRVTIPNSVTSIGFYAFSGCLGLTSIEIPNNVTSIGDYAFSGCLGLTSIEIPNNVTSIGDHAFYNCSGLKRFTIPNSVTRIGNNAFDGTEWYNNQQDGVVYANKVLYKYKGTMYYNTSITIESGTLVIADNAFDGCSGLTSIEIPNSVTSIGEYAFSGCSRLTSVTIGNSVTSIGERVFYNCSGLTSVTIPNSVTSIGGWAFSGCSGLTSVTIGNSVTSIGSGAFQYCSGLTSIEIPNSVTSIGDYAFNYCSGLTSIVIPNSVTSIGESAFSGCDAIENVELNCSSIGNWFSGKTSLKEVVIGNDVTEIGYEAFYNCQNLESLVISGNITSIGIGAFQNCTALTTIRSLISAENLFTPGDYAFEGVDKDVCILYVPQGAKETYATTAGWSDFANIEDGADVFTITYMIDGEVYKEFTLEYGAEIPAVEAPVREGYTFSGWSEIPATMPAEDITVEGTFSVNTYVITYLVDGEVYATDSVAYGSEIVLIDEPAKEGYTFSGWSEVPETMPAEDIVVEGTFVKKETGIEEVQCENGVAKTIYDLQGRKVTHPIKGIYIVNGRKVVK